MDSIGSFIPSSFSEPKVEKSIHSGYETDDIICNRYRVFLKRRAVPWAMALSSTALIYGTKPPVC